VGEASERRVIRLDAVRADGWFERLGENSPSFPQLCEVVGDKFVAFAVIAGVRVTSVTVDRRAPDATLVDFVVGEDTAEQRLPLGEFRRRLGAALLGDEPEPEALPDDPDVESIQAFFGFRYVLLAPVFGIRLKELRIGDSKEPTLVVHLGGAQDEISVEDFREVIRERIRGEVARHRPAQPFAIDLGAIPQAARALESGDHERTIELLGAWPGPLSLLLRTAEGQQLAPEVKATLARALGLLGTAYVKEQRYEWAEEVLRLGIQWGQDGSAAADLFRRLGEACVARGRHGEAIGLLRRAISLGAPQREVLPVLARCYAERKRWVACMVCVDEAVAIGVDDAMIAEQRAQALDALGGNWERLRRLVPVPRSASQTIPAPPMKTDG
jgi:tetratricopeptide (TPR) repeat protein